MTSVNGILLENDIKEQHTYVEVDNELDTEIDTELDTEINAERLDDKQRAELKRVCKDIKSDGTIVEVVQRNIQEIYDQLDKEAAQKKKDLLNKPKEPTLDPNADEEWEKIRLSI